MGRDRASGDPWSLGSFRVGGACPLPVGRWSTWPSGPLLIVIRDASPMAARSFREPGVWPARVCRCRHGMLAAQRRTPLVARLDRWCLGIVGGCPAHPVPDWRTW
jgi:hypothetical protein